MAQRVSASAIPRRRVVDLGRGLEVEFGRCAANASREFRCRPIFTTHRARARARRLPPFPLARAAVHGRLLRRLSGASSGYHSAQLVTIDLTTGEISPRLPTSPHISPPLVTVDLSTGEIITRLSRDYPSRVAERSREEPRGANSAAAHPAATRVASPNLLHSPNMVTGPQASTASRCRTGSAPSPTPSRTSTRGGSRSGARDAVACVSIAVARPHGPQTLPISPHISPSLPISLLLSARPHRHPRCVSPPSCRSTPGETPGGHQESLDGKWARSKFATLGAEDVFLYSN